MTKLLTHHDPFHLHAVLGFITLLHFSFRVLLALALGDAFPFGRRTLALDLFLVLLHAMLPLSSLLLNLPTKRNFNSPMIWPEFRMHSLTFATRHVLATLLWMILRRESPESTPWNGLISMSNEQVCACLLLLHGTMFAATFITNSLGDPKMRTTNAMPYDPSISNLQRQRAKRLYAFAQFQAAAFVFAGDPTVAFIPLTGIQSAPLLMTLVRKGKCSAATYHCLYTWSLLVPLLVLVRVRIAGSLSITALNTVVAVGSLAFWLRTSHGQPKHLVWLVAPAVAWAMCRFAPPEVAESALIVPIAIIAGLGVSSLLIPNVMFPPSLGPFVEKNGELLVATVYFAVAATHILSARSN